MVVVFVALVSLYRVHSLWSNEFKFIYDLLLISFNNKKQAHSQRAVRVIARRPQLKWVVNSGGGGGGSAGSKSQREECRLTYLCGKGGPNTVVKQRNHFASNFRIWQRNVDRHLPQGSWLCEMWAIIMMVIMIIIIIVLLPLGSYFGLIAWH